MKTGAAQAQSTTQNVNDQIATGSLRAARVRRIALFVGSFVIFNTLSVTVAQRTRELATLRTLGASRRQVLASVLLEAFVIGVLASLIGLVAGLGLAKALESMFASMGMQLPNAGTVFATRTVTRQPDGGDRGHARWRASSGVTGDPRSADCGGPRGRDARRPADVRAPRSVLLGVVGFTGAAVLAAGLFDTGLGTAARLLLLAGGAAFLFIGIAFVSRWLIAPLANAVGRPFDALTGAAGLLARENSSRNPARTAVTAGALTVGLALVAFVATLGAGLRGTINDAVRQQIHADYVISADNATLPPTVSAPFEASYRTITATGIRQGQIQRVRQDRGAGRRRPGDDRTVLQLQMGGRVERDGARATGNDRRDHQHAVRRRPPPAHRQQHLAADRVRHEPRADRTRDSNDTDPRRAARPGHDQHPAV